MLQKYGFDVENNSDANEEIDTDFQELFEQISAENTIDEYIDFDADVVTSLPAIDQLMVDWRKVSLEKSITKVVHNSKDVEEIESPEMS